MNNGLIALFFLLFSSVSFSQDEYDRYSYNVEINGMLQELRFGCSKPIGKWTTNECWLAENHRRFMHSVQNMDSVELDTVHRLFEKIVSPILGREIFSRTFLAETHEYNTGYRTILDSITKVEFEQDQPECLKVKYSFDCYFMFEDSIWFPFEICADEDGQLMSQSSIVSTLKALESYKLKSPVAVFKKAYFDRSMKKYAPRKYFDLKYSEQLHYFYFEIESNDGDLVKRDKTSVTTLHPHIYIDAFTGKILWRVNVEHFYESNGCLIINEIHIPNSPLTGQP